MTIDRNRFGVCLLALVMGTISTNAFGEGKPGFHKPGEADRPVGSTSTSASTAPKKYTLSELATVALPTKNAWTDHFDHVTDGGSYVSKGLSNVTAIAVLDGKPVIAASFPGETNQVLVYNDKATTLLTPFEAKSPITQIVVIGTRVFAVASVDATQQRFWVYDSENERVTWYSDYRWKPASILQDGYSVTVPAPRPFVPTSPVVAVDVTTISHGVTVRGYISAGGKPLLPHDDPEGGQRVWWGETETRLFDQIDNLVYQGGKVSFVGVKKLDYTSRVCVVSYDGKESESLYLVSAYAVTDAGLPMWTGRNYEAKYSYGEGTKTVARYNAIGASTYANGHMYFAAQDKQ